MWRMPNHLHPPAKMLLDPTLASACVDLIHPQMFDTRKLLVGALQQQRHTRAILDIGSVHFGAQHETASIDEDVAFAAVDALGAIVATYAADASRPYGLAVDNAGARVGIAADAGAELLAKCGVYVFPRAIQTPKPEIVIRGLPGRKLMRQQPPGTATPNNIEDRVEDLTHGMQSGSATSLRWRQQRLQASELSIRQVGQVRAPRGQTPAILPAKPTRVPVFRQFLVDRHGRSAG